MFCHAMSDVRGQSTAFSAPQVAARENARPERQTRGPKHTRHVTAALTALSAYRTGSTAQSNQEQGCGRGNGAHDEGHGNHGARNARDEGRLVGELRHLHGPRSRADAACLLHAPAAKGTGRFRGRWSAADRRAARRASTSAARRAGHETRVRCRLGCCCDGCRARKVNRAPCLACRSRRRVHKAQHAYAAISSQRAGATRVAASLADAVDSARRRRTHVLGAASGANARSRSTCRHRVCLMRIDASLGARRAA